MTRIPIVTLLILISTSCDRPKNSRVLTNPSLQKNYAMIKYMNDNGVPVMVSLMGPEPVNITSARSLVALAIQDGRTPTEHFIIVPGADVQISYDVRGNFIVRQNLDVDLLPFDVNYLRQRDSLLFANRPSAMSEFVRYWMILELNGLADTDDPSLLQDLSVLRNKAYVDLSRERQLLDSLENFNLMSPGHLEFYKLLNKFDSIRIGVYPHFNDSTKLLPDLAMTLVKPKIFPEKKHLTFYDDWMRKHSIETAKQPNIRALKQQK